MVAKPHGGRLVRRVASERTRERIIEEASEYPTIHVSEEIAVDVENIAYGVYSPIEGFLTASELESVLQTMRLPDDTPWTIPIVLDVREGEVTFSEGDEVLLIHGEFLARLRVEEVFPWDRREYAQKVFGTIDTRHPGVEKTLRMGELLVGGEIELIRALPNPFAERTLTPLETRVLFRERGWKTVVGFQTRNVPHLGHEYVQKSALTFVDGLFVNPVLGKKKPGDFRDEVIWRAYEALFEHYYPKNAAVLSFVRYPMRYAGPREAVHHAIMRKNFGCTHFIVGRDHAGVGGFYHPYAAHEIFSEFPDLGITPLFFREFFYCKRCGTIVNERICPHPKDDRVYFSGTKLRDMIRRGERPPEMFMRPEVYEAIASFENPFQGG